MVLIGGPFLMLRLTPHGRLVAAPAEDVATVDPALARRLGKAFGRGVGYGLLRLGAAEVGQVLPAVLSWWREFGTLYVTAVCALPDADDCGGRLRVPPPPNEQLDAIALAAPPMPGGEYLTADVLRSLWSELEVAFRDELSEAGGSVQDLLRGLNPAWNLVGRVHFNLAENRRDEAAPFAFLATYTTRLSGHAKAQHTPLGQALREYAGAANRHRLLSLLLPVQRAAESCDWLRDMVEAGEIFHPLRWSAGEAWRLLRDVSLLDRAGVVVRMPANWSAGRPPRPRVTATVGGRVPSVLGLEALLDFQVGITLEGEALTRREIEELLARTEGLALVRGRWVEVDHARLERTLGRMRAVEKLAGRDGLPFAAAMQLLAGTDVAAAEGRDGLDPEWAGAVAGPWLAEILSDLRSPAALAGADPGRDLHGTLRPYQVVGVRWLHLLSRLGLGACLADDMGLGKTVQVLALLLVARRETGAKREPCLLVAPASILANWAAETARFAPDLKMLVAHPSALPAGELKAIGPKQLAKLDLVITSYGSLLRLPWLAETSWRLVILDEAQAIKNPGAKQTRAARKLQARARIALTGTPVENRLADLWSIFDFINPGLLGSAKEFTAYTKRLSTRSHNAYAPLRELVRPYILRRMKTDRSVIADLPDKTEVKAW